MINCQWLKSSLGLISGKTFHRVLSSMEMLLLFCFTQVVMGWPLWKFSHGVTAVLSWYVQNFVAMWYPTLKPIPSNLNCDEKIVFLRWVDHLPNCHQAITMTSQMRRSWDRLIFIMGIPTLLVRRCLYIETILRVQQATLFRYSRSWDLRYRNSAVLAITPHFLGHASVLIARRLLISTIHHAVSA